MSIAKFKIGCCFDEEKVVQDWSMDERSAENVKLFRMGSFGKVGHARFGEVHDTENVRMDKKPMVQITQ